MTVPVFDCDKWYVSAHSLTCAPTTFSAGRGLGGFKQVRFAPNNYWRGTLNIDPIFGRDANEFRGFIAGLQGSFGVFDMCLCEPYSVRSQDDLNDLLGLSGPNDLPFSDEMLFSDGTGFQIPEYVAAQTVSTAAEGDTSIQMNDAHFYNQVGSKFSTDDGFLHMVTAVNGPDLTITPPLRRDIAAGETLETSKPKVRVRLAEDTSGTITSNHGRWTDAVTLSVEEVLER